MSLPKIRYFLALDAERRASDRAFHAETLSLAAALPYAKGTGQILNDLIAELYWLAGMEDAPEVSQASLESSFASVFGAIGIPGGN